MINLSVDGVRAVSEWEGKEIIAKGVNKKKVEVITNGIEDEAYQDSEQDASEAIKKQVGSYGRYIIQIGRVYVIKNYETVIRALPKLPKDIKYLIVGPVENNYHDSYKPGLEKLASELGVSDRVLFLGVIKGVDKYYLIKHAQLMVHMALWESFCNVVHEGMSQGLPCIVSNVYALPYLIKDGENGYCLPVKDSGAVADKINYVLENMESDTIKEMRKVNKEFGLKHSWTNVAESMCSFYNKQRGLKNE
jgi:D-inositol-3-phosphate glycosyltransferase